MSKVLLVTGAGRGIGAAIARAAGKEGYAVVVNYSRSKDQADAVVRDITGAGGEAIAVQGDMASERDIQAVFAAIDKTYGRLDALVNNAGIIGRRGRVDTVEAAAIAELLALNVTGAFICAREAVKRMSTAHGGKGGVIVNVGSAATRLGGSGEYVPYAASKGAINVLTIGLAKEVALEGIRVNTVEPGLIATEIHYDGRLERLGPTVPMGRVASPEEVAGPVLFLLSDAASYMTGSIVTVTGGR
ncbi:MAG TPA: SDR family oxidoreductase [Dongiaceae bacterium]|jgi:NAD(P)-dependent dehydrogenase (short-subunit alcohol dehydrogenase family)|nr:SDR family oxidoreductase [Dongiaceae bacterium]